MVPVQQGSYVFRKESLIEVRQKLGLSQTQMANRLQVPKNTLSRWETGSTTPDANSLAAIYSIAMEGGFMPMFFTPEKEKAAVRSRVLAYWDVQTVASHPQYLAHWASVLQRECKRRVPQYNFELWKAFLHSTQSELLDRVEETGWRAWEDSGDLLDDIYQQTLSDVGQDPNASAVFLITTDLDFVGLIRQLRERGVRVYLVTPPLINGRQVDQTLIDAVGQRRHITLDAQPWELFPAMIHVRQRDWLAGVLRH